NLLPSWNPLRSSRRPRSQTERLNRRLITISSGQLPTPRPGKATVLLVAHSHRRIQRLLTLHVRVSDLRRLTLGLTTSGTSRLENAVMRQRTRSEILRGGSDMDNTLRHAPILKRLPQHLSTSSTGDRNHRRITPPLSQPISQHRHSRLSFRLLAPPRIPQLAKHTISVLPGTSNRHARPIERERHTKRLDAIRGNINT